MRFSPTYPEYHGNRRQPRVYDAVPRKTVPRDDDGSIVSTMRDWTPQQISDFYTEHEGEAFFQNDTNK